MSDDSTDKDTAGDNSDDADNTINLNGEEEKLKMMKFIMQILQMSRQHENVIEVSCMRSYSPTYIDMFVDIRNERLSLDGLNNRGIYTFVRT